MASIAAQTGFTVAAIWDFPANSELKKSRKNPYTLAPGDVVTIPPTKEKTRDCPTDRKYKFVLKTEPEYLRLLILDGDAPFRIQAYELEVDGVKSTGTTDNAGALERQISPTAKEGKLRVGSGVNERSYVLRLGHLQPLELLAGGQGRLFDLGYYEGEVTGKLDGLTRVALLRFQTGRKLKETGEYDAATQDELKKVFGF